MIYFSLAVHVWFLDKVFYLIPKIVRKEVENGNSSGPHVLIKSVSSNFCVCGKFPAKALDGNMLKDWPSFLGVVILQKLKP